MLQIIYVSHDSKLEATSVLITNGKWETKVDILNYMSAYFIFDDFSQIIDNL